MDITPKVWVCSWYVILRGVSPRGIVLIWSFWISSIVPIKNNNTVLIASFNWRVCSRSYAVEKSKNINSLWSVQERQDNVSSIPIVTVVSVASAKLSGYASAFNGHMCLTSLKLTLENTNFWVELYITVGLSEQAKTLFVVDCVLNLRNTVGCVPSVT